MQGSLHCKDCGNRLRFLMHVEVFLTQTLPLTPCHYGDDGRGGEYVQQSDIDEDSSTPTLECVDCGLVDVEGTAGQEELLGKTVRDFRKIWGRRQ